MTRPCDPRTTFMQQILDETRSRADIRGNLSDNEFDLFKTYKEIPPQFCPLEFQQMMENSEVSSFNDDGIPQSEEELFASPWNECEAGDYVPPITDKKETLLFRIGATKFEPQKNDAEVDREIRKSAIIEFKSYLHKKRAVRAFKRLKKLQEMNLGDPEQEAAFLKNLELVDKKLNRGFYYEKYEPPAFTELLRKRRKAVKRKYDLYALDDDYRAELNHRTIACVQNALGGNDFSYAARALEILKTAADRIENLAKGKCEQQQQWNTFDEEEFHKQLWPEPSAELLSMFIADPDSVLHTVSHTIRLPGTPEESSCPRQPTSPRPQQPRSPCPRQPTSPCPRQPTSPCPRQPASPCPRQPVRRRLLQDISVEVVDKTIRMPQSTSPCPRESTSSCPRQPTSPCPRRPTSPSPGRPTSPCPRQPTSQSPRQPTSPCPREPTSTCPRQPTSPCPRQPTSPCPRQPTSPSPRRPTSPCPRQPTSPSSRQPTSPCPREPTSPCPRQPTSPCPRQPTSPCPRQPTSPQRPVCPQKPPPNDDDLSSMYDDRVPESEIELFTSDFEEDEEPYPRRKSRRVDKYNRLLNTCRPLPEDTEEELKRKRLKKIYIEEEFRKFLDRRKFFKALARFKTVEEMNLDPLAEAKELIYMEMVDKHLEKPFYYEENEPEKYKKLKLKRQRAIFQKYVEYPANCHYRDFLKLQAYERFMKTQAVPLFERINASYDDDDDDLDNSSLNDTEIPTSDAEFMSDGEPCLPVDFVKPLTRTKTALFEALEEYDVDSNDSECVASQKMEARLNAIEEFKDALIERRKRKAGARLAKVDQMGVTNPKLRAAELEKQELRDKKLNKRYYYGHGEPCAYTELLLKRRRAIARKYKAYVANKDFREQMEIRIAAELDAIDHKLPEAIKCEPGSFESPDPRYRPNATATGESFVAHERRQNMRLSARLAASEPADMFCDSCPGAANTQGLQRWDNCDLA